MVRWARKRLPWEGALGTRLAQERPGSGGPGSLREGQGPPGETSLGCRALGVRARAEFRRRPFPAGWGPRYGPGAGVPADSGRKVLGGSGNLGAGVHTGIECCPGPRGP